MRIRSAITVLLFAIGLAVMAAAQATPAPAHAGGQKGTPAAQAAAAGDYVGSETCITCHDDQNQRFKNTTMGKSFAHATTTKEKLGCEACHGPGKAHVEAGGGKDTIPVRFGKDSRNPVEEQNAACLSCHARGNRLYWTGSPHEARGMACVDCHQVKQGKHESLSAETRFNAPLTEVEGTKKSEPELCLTCHTMRKAQLMRSSHMPFREGKVTCTSCHNPHGTPYAKQLLQPTVNENCYSCHAERRGPFLWEHPPVMENCDNCHEPHGSSAPQLLKTRMPRVCNECHITNRHPTQPQNINVKVFNRGCTNCHSELHGSNHPSGNMFLR